MCRRPCPNIIIIIINNNNNVNNNNHAPLPSFFPTGTLAVEAFSIGNDQCFLFDDLSPYIVKFLSPAAGSTTNGAPKEVVIQFSEEIRAGPADAVAIEVRPAAPAAAAAADAPAAASFKVGELTFAYESTQFWGDTVRITGFPAKSAFAELQDSDAKGYIVSVLPSAFEDTSGNAFVGSGGISDEKLAFTVAPYEDPNGDGGGGGGTPPGVVVVVVLVVLAVLAGIGFFVWRRLKAGGRAHASSMNFSSSPSDYREVGSI